MIDIHHTPLHPPFWQLGAIAGHKLRGSGREGVLVGHVNSQSRLTVSTASTVIL